MMLFRGLLIATLAWVPLTARGQDDAGPSQDEAAIRKTVESYAETYNGHDAKALAAFWSPDAVYTNRATGAQVTGRDEIEKQFAAMFEQDKQSKLELNTQSVRFISPNVAVEDGSARVLRPDEPPEQSDYTAVYIHRDGKWLLDRVTDTDTSVPAVATHYEHLKQLEWMIGEWVDEDDNATIVTQCQWTRNNNFMTRSFTVSIGDQVDLAGMQIIGWDPAAKQIRSWVFDSDGGFGHGVWTRKDDCWFVRKAGVLADGGKTSAVNIIRYIDHDTCTLQSVARTVDGEILPNIDEVKIVRKAAE